MRYPYPAGIEKVLNLSLRERMVEGPAAEIACPGQPRIGSQYRLAVRKNDDAGIAKGFELRAHQFYFGSAPTSAGPLPVMADSRPRR